MIAIKWTPVYSAIDAKSHLPIREEGKEDRAGAIYSPLSLMVSGMNFALSRIPGHLKQKYKKGQHTGLGPLRDCTLRTLERTLDSWRSNFQPDQVASSNWQLATGDTTKGTGL